MGNVAETVGETEQHLECFEDVEFGSEDEILVLFVEFLGLEVEGGMLGLEGTEAAVDTFAVDYCGSSDKPFHFQLYNVHLHQ